jgi:hypothetical protein
MTSPPQEPEGLHKEDHYIDGSHVRMLHYRRAMGDCGNHPINSADTNDCYTKSHPLQVTSDPDPD